MTPSQKITLRISEVRQRLNEIAGLEGDAFTDEFRNESDTLQAEFRDLENRYRAAVIGEANAEERARAAFIGNTDAETRERLELRGKATVTGYVLAAMQGRLPSGAEAELQAAADVDGIPLEIFEPAPERRADATTAAPGTVGVNLQPIRPAVFAASIATRLGIDMPRVPSGTYAEARIDTSLTAAAKAAGGDAEATAATFVVSTATPKRVSARLGIRAEDIASVGQANFEAALRQNLSLALSDELDDQVINGDESAPNLTGLLKRLTDPTDPTAVAKFDDFLAAFADAVDGLWANTTKDVAIVSGPATYKLSAKAFRDVGSNNGHRGDISFSDYAMTHMAGWWTNKRMPDAASNIQAGILHRRGRTGIRTAVCPHWGSISIDDIYSGSARAQRYVSMHVLLGDVIIVQPDAYAQVAFKLA